MPVGPSGLLRVEQWRGRHQSPDLRSVSWRQVRSAALKLLL